MLEEVLSHLGLRKADSRGTVIEADYVPVAEQNLGDVVLYLDEYELVFIGLVREKITDIAVNNEQIRCIGTVLV
jgi:hypothetical protein